MKKILTVILFISAALSCKHTPSAIPLGSWDYNILVNGTKTGTALIKTTFDGNNYESKTFMEIKAGNITNTTEQILVETAEFKPVKLEIKNRIIHDNIIEKIDTMAEFKGNQITLLTDGNKKTFIIEKPFVLDGNLYMRELMKANFKKGTTFTLSIYEPTIEVDEPIQVKIAVIGRKKIDINGTTKELIHIVQFIAGIKSVDFFIDETGITYKAVIVMLNNKLELILQ